MYRQNPSAPRRTISLAEPPRCTGSPSGPLPSIDQSTTIWAVSPPTNTWRTLAFSGRPRLISRWNWAAISVRSVMVRPSFAMTTASGAYKAIIASTFPELNRSISDGITPSGSVGSGKDFDIRISFSGLLNRDAAMTHTIWLGRQWPLFAAPDELFQIARKYSSDSGAE